MTVRTPGTPLVDLRTGNPKPGTPVVTETRAYLSQSPVTIVSASPELRATQDTTITTYTLLVPATVPMTSGSTVTDEDGAVYAVVGQPASRAGLGRAPKFMAVSLHRISDLQT